MSQHKKKKKKIFIWVEHNMQQMMYTTDVKNKGYDAKCLFQLALLSLLWLNWPLSRLTYH